SRDLAGFKRTNKRTNKRTIKRTTIFAGLPLAPGINIRHNFERSRRLQEDLQEDIQEDLQEDHPSPVTRFYLINSIQSPILSLFLSL
ncbi:unnamed protein product, partial [Darwinula stevensoni]